MMRKNLILLILFICNFSYSQDFEIVDGDYTYTKVIEVDKTKNELYSALKKWLNNTTVKAKLAIDQDDPTLGIISFNEGLPEMEYSYMYSSQVSYKISIDIKDKKIRYRVNNIVFNNKFAGLANYKRTYFDFLEDIKKEKDKLLTNQNLLDQETKGRKKKEYEYERNNARNNLRSLTSIEEALKNQIKFNEETIKSKISESDDW